MAYLNFDLKLSGEGPRAFHVEVVNSPRSMRSDPTPAEIPERLLALWPAQLSGGRECERACEELGRAIYVALFPPAVMEVWHESRKLLGKHDRLRLRLDIRSPQLAAVPWELIHDGGSNRGRGWHMALVRSTPVVRHPYGHPPAPPDTGARPLNVLVLTSSPHNVPPLPEAESEAEAVVRILSGLKAEGKAGRVDLLPHVTKESLLRQIQKHEYHVLHFIGHGDFEDEKGYLAFEGEGGNVDLVGGEALAYRFKESALRLLFLNSCKSAVASRRGALLGAAQAALAAGVPAAVAMQDEIGDAAAAAFAREFYRALAGGVPLDDCVREGRLGIFDAAGPRRADWAVPVLFSNVEDGLLWKRPEAEVGREEGRNPVTINEQTVYSKGNRNVIAQNLYGVAHGREDD